MTSEEQSELERRRKTLETLVDLYQGGAESSCYGPDRAERLLKQQSSAEELRKIGVGDAVIDRLFGSVAEDGLTGVEPGSEDRAETNDAPEAEESSAHRGSFSIRVEARFEAAHFLRSYRGISEPLHGHSYRVEAELEREGGSLDDDELAVDFVQSRKELERIASRLDYTCINEVEPFDRLNPTAENVARWFQEELQSSIGSAGALVTEVRLFEGPMHSVTYRPPGRAAGR